MSELKKKRYIVGILIIVLLVGVVGLFSNGKIDKYKGLVKVNEIKLLSSVGNAGALTSKGTEEVKYTLTYTLDPVEGLTKRDVIIKGKLNSGYATFKSINKTNITSTLKENGKEIEIEVKDVTLGEEQRLEIPIQITNAPNNETITPEIKIKEATGEETSVVGEPIIVETNSVQGIVYDENNIPVGNIELSINKDGREIKRTYTRDNGTYTFSDLEAGVYQIKVEEEVYELVSGSETSESSQNNIIKVKQVDKYNIETHKYIEKLDLVINGKKQNYTYKDAEKIVQAIKNAKTISGEIEYKIVVKNKSEKGTRVERIEDFPGEGLEFKESKNSGWKKEVGKIIYKPLEGATLEPKETREIKIVLDITDTKEIKTYINKLTTRGKIEEKVVYVLNGDVIREEKVAEGDIITRPDFDIDNLDGWYTDKNYTNKYKFSNRVNKNLILYGKTEQEIKKYTVKFIDEGTEVESKEVIEGNTVNRIEDPSKDGYDFECWTLDNICYDFDTPVTRDINLVSKYKVKEYDINYILNGGTNDPDNPSKYTKESETIVLKDASKEGYTFTGWTGNGTTEPTKGLEIVSGSTGNKEFTASYTPINYSIEYINTCGALPAGATNPDSYNIESADITLLNPSKEGYEFKGWKVFGESDDTASTTTVIPQGSMGNKKYEAVCTAIEYEITYHLDGGSLEEGKTNPSKYTIEDTFTLNNPVKVGHTFTGWEEEGVSGKKETVTVPVGTTGNKVYTAKYSLDAYTLTIDPAGGTYEGELVQTNDYGTIITIEDAAKNGYTFTDWTLEGAGLYNNKTYTYGVGNGKLTANYTLNEYDIDYDYSSCGLTNEEIEALNNRTKYTVEMENFQLNEPNKYGYIFDGWTGSNGNAPTKDVTVQTNQAVDLTYVANCHLQKFTVTFKDGESILGTKQVEYNHKVTPIETPQKNGYSFDKWLLNGEEYNFNNLVTEDITLQAKFDVINYTIEYDGITEEERAQLSNKTSYNIETESFNINNPSDRLDVDQSGEVFIGWQEENETTPSMLVTLPDVAKLGNKKYTAKWNHREPNVYNITYNLNEGTLETANPSTYKKSELPITLNEPIKEGHTFTGWTGSNGTTPEKNYKIPVNTTGDLNYIANYNRNQYTVEFYNRTAEGGYEKINDATLSKLYGDNIVEDTKPTAGLNGYSFKFWSKDKQVGYQMDSPITENIKLYAMYDTVEYDIDYVLNGGTNDPSNPSTYTIESDDIELKDATKTGYTFKGWTGNGTTEPTKKLELPSGSTGDKEFTANFEVNTYEISYDYSSCNLTPEEIAALNNTTSYTIETANFTLNNPNKYGYVFNGWSGTDLDGSTNTNVEVDTSKIKNLSYVANCTLDKYEVEFYNMESDETTYTKEKTVSNIEYGSTIPQAQVPTVELLGYTFEYWSLDKSTRFELTTPITEDTKLYAVYSKDLYNITYNLDGGVVTVPNPTQYSVDTASFTLNPPTKEGFDFKGWSGTDLVGIQTEVTLPDLAHLGDKVFTANYDEKVFTVNFYRMKSDKTYELISTASLQKNYGSDILDSELPSTTDVDLTGYTFNNKWLLDSSEGTEYNIATPITSNINLYADYTKDVYTITYNLNEGTVAVENPTEYSVDTPTFRLNEPTKVGHDFIGWTGSNGTNPLKNVEVTKGTTGNLVFTANYEPKTFTVTYMNGTSLFLTQSDIPYNTATTAPTQKPTKPHNLFTKWVKEDGTDFDFATLITEDITLYASYELIEPPVITHYKTEWVRDKVDVTITSDHDDYTYKYRIGTGSDEDYSSPFPVTQNTTIYAYSVKDGVVSEEVSHVIDNIDKINPTITSVEPLEVLPESIKIRITAQDNESGLDKFTIYVNNTEVHTSDSYITGLNDEKIYDFTITNLEQRTDYTIKVEAYDKVENMSYDEQVISTIAKHYVARVVGPTYDAPYDDQDEQYYFESLKQALESETCQGASCVIQMLEDVEETNVVLNGQDVTIDLNGTTITGLQDNALTNSGILKIVDKNQDEIGKVYSEGTAIINNGKLYIGENETALVVDPNEPIIEGTETGIDSPGELHFLDGKIIGSSTSGALKGTAPITPFSYNASVDTTGGKEIATLEVIADAEARINSVYYTKAQEAIDASKNGSYTEGVGSTDIMKQIESRADYRFVYDDETGKLTSNNQRIPNSTADSFIVFDLTNETTDKVISIDATISSQNEYNDAGYITVTNSSKTPAYDQEDGRIMYVSGEMNDNVNYILEKGNKYYVHLCYHKNGSYDYYDDTFTINSITLSDYTKSNTNGEVKDNMISEDMWHFIKQPDGSYANRNRYNNGNYNRNTIAHSYIKFDLTNEANDKILYVDATLSGAYTNRDYAYITVTNSDDKPAYDQEEGRQVFLTGTVPKTSYEIKLKKGEINYVHFGAYYTWNYYTFSIDSVRLQDEVEKEHLNSDVTPAESYYMEETDYEPTVWKDLTNNHTVLTYNKNWNETNGSFDINGQESYYAYIPGGVTDVLDEESVEVEVSATTVNSSNIIYNGSNKEKVLIGIYNGYFIVSNNYTYYNTFNVPDDFYDGEKKNLILTYNNGNYELYYNKVKLEKNTAVDRWCRNDANTYIGRLQSSTSDNFNGSIYKVKVYNRELSEAEISSTISDTGLILSLDGSDHKKLLDAPAFINNNSHSHNTKADSYMVFDLTNLPSKTIYVNAEISSEENGDYGFVYVSNNINDRNSYNHTSGRYVLLSGEVDAQEYPVTLTGGQVNYVHFAYQKNGSVDSGKDQFKINYVRYYDDALTKVPTYIISNPSTTKPISPAVVLNDQVETVELLRNITMTNPLEIEETRDVILDLRGYTLTTNKQDYVINNRGSLTIVDSDYDAQRNSSLEKYARERAEFDGEYETAIQAKTDYINEKQAEYDTEYNTEMAYYNEKQQSAEANYNALAEEYLTYMNSAEYDNKISNDFYYTGSYQEFTAPFTGTYQIEAWGAQGNTTASKRTEGGKGAYTSGKITLNEGEKIYIYVGEHREDTNSSFNAGSTGGSSIADGRVNGYGGGGATDIRLVSGNWNDQTSLASRIMVAGGGGGATDYNYPSDGGYGGSLVGGSGITGYYPGYTDNIVPTGGTQTSGGTGSNSQGPGYIGQFGFGGNGNSQWGSGGGGGYYGGGGGGWNSYQVDSGAGGSSYISGHTGSVAINAADDITPKTGCDNGTTDITCSYHYSGKKFTDTVMKTGNEEIPSSEGTGISIGQSGNGHVRISYTVQSGNYSLDEAKYAISNLKYNYTYNGSYQEFTAPITAKYRIETWGAAGGSNVNSSGGNGGYSEGLISLTKGDKLYIYVGEKGKTKAYNNYGDSYLVNGGYNGGGNGYLSRTTCNQYVSSGGGATDIRLVSGDWNSNQSLASRIMVAAGGGGSFSNNCGTSDRSNTTGGNAGGLSGNKPVYISMAGFSDLNPTGGTQTTGGLSVDDWQASTYSSTYSGSFGSGSGGTGPFGGDGSYSGGGAGYYGGASGKWQAGAGGSGYISGYKGSVAIEAEDNTNPKYGCEDGTTDITCSYHYSGKVFEETTMKSGNEKMPSYTSSSGMIGNTGNGFARITFADNSSTYETPNALYDNMVSSLNVTDYFDTLTYMNSANWSNKLDNSEATIVGSINKEDDAIRVNNINSRNTVKIPIDNTGDTIIYSLVKVNQNASNSSGTRILELYSGLDFSYKTPMVYARNNQICIDAYNRASCSSNIDFNNYNLITMTISRDTNMLRLYVNGEYLTQVSYSDYGNILWLSHSNNNNISEYGDNSYRMLAIGNSIPTDNIIRDNSNKIIDFYNDTSNKVVIRKDASIEPTTVYTDNDYITDGLLLHLDGIESGDDPTIWEDLSGNNNNGNIYNLYKNSNGSYYFSGSNSYVEIPNSPITIDKQETVDILFRPDVNSSYRNESIYNGGTNEKITITTHAQYLRVGLSNSTNLYNVPADFYDGTVKKLSVVYDNGNYTVYYNNTELTKLESKDYIGKNTSTYIGRRNDGYNFAGSIYNVKVYDRALKRDEIQRNYNVDITRYNIDYAIEKREPTMDVSNLNGKVTNTNYSTIYNENGALLNIKEAVVEIDKEGNYYAVDNHGMLTMESDGYINTRKRYNYGINNAINGDILNGSGTITTYLGDSYSIVNVSQEDAGFTGYNLVSTISSSIGMLNRGKKDIEINSINITGNGVGFRQDSNNKCTINNSTIDSNTVNVNSIQSIDNRSTGSINSELVLNNISTNNTISNTDYSYRKIIIKDSTLSLKKTSVGSQVFNSTGEIELDNVTFNSCPNNYVIENYTKATLKNSLIEIPETCENMPKVFSSGSRANIDIEKTKFKKHSTNTGSETEFNTNNNWKFVYNTTDSTMTIDESTFETDSKLSMAIQNAGANLTIKGKTEIKDSFVVGIANIDGWYYSRYNPTLTIGENDTEVSTTYPKIKATDYGVLTVDKKINENFDGKFYFYDGVLIGKEDKALYSSVSGMPVDYDINSTVATGIETVKLKPYDSDEDEDMVCKIGSTKYATIQDAVDHVPANTETTIDIIKDIKTALDVTIPSNKIVKLNYNNHYVKSHIYGDYIVNNGNLKIYDNSASVTAVSDFYSDNYIKNNGILDLNDIKLNGLYPDSKILTANGTSNTINSGIYKVRGTAISNNSSNTVINDGELRSYEGNNMSLIDNSETGTLTINDGYFYKYGAHMINNYNTLNINDGIFLLRASEASIVLNNQGKTTINGGKFDNSQRKYNEEVDNTCYVVWNKSEAELNNIEVKYGHIIYNETVNGAENKSEATLNSVTANSIYSGMYGDAIKNYAAKLTINSSTLKGLFKIDNGGYSESRGELYINGSTLKTDSSYPILHTTFSDTYLDSITKNGVTTRTSLESSWGTPISAENQSVIDINDTDITNTSTNNDADGITVSGMNWPDDRCTITINNSNITSSGRAGIYQYSAAGLFTLTVGTKGAPVSNVIPKIEGGTYGIYSPNENVIFNFYDGRIIGSTNNAIVIKLNENEPQYDIIAEDSAGKQTKYNAQVPAYKNTTTGEEYDSLQDAFDEASDNDTIKVQREVTIMGSVAPASNSKKVTFDLNGKKIIQNNATYITNTATGNLTIEDSTAEFDENGILVGTGQIESKGSLIIDNAGTLSLESGDLHTQYNKIVNNTGTMIINNGKYYLTAANLGALDDLFNSSGTLTVNNGYFKEVARNVGVTNTYIFNNSGTATINDGVFEGIGYESYGDIRDVVVLYNSTAGSHGYIYGGSFKRDTDGTTGVLCRLMDNSGTGIIKDVDTEFSYLAHNLSGGTLTIEDTTLGGDTPMGYGTGAYGGNALSSDGTLLTIDNLTVKNVSAVKRFFGVSGGSTTIDNSSIKVSDYEYAITTSNDASLTIDNSTIESNTGCIDMQNTSTVTIDNTDTDKETIIKTTNTESTNSDRNCIYNESDGLLSINKGSILGENTYSAIKISTYYSNKFINIGTKDNVAGDKPVIKGSTYGIYNEHNSNVYDVTLNFYDGVIRGDKAIEEIINSTDTYINTSNVEKEYNVLRRIVSNKEEKYLGKSTIATVIRTNNDEDGFYDLKEAFDSANNNETVRIDEDIILTSSTSTITIPSTKKITLDLNNHYIYLSANDFITNNGELIIDDTSVDKDGYIKAFDSAFITNNGTFTFKKGKMTSERRYINSIVNNGTYNNSGGDFIVFGYNDNNGISISNNGIMNITSGKLEHTYSYCAFQSFQGYQGTNFIMNNTGATINMSGGEVTSHTLGNTFNNEGTLNITGGDLTKNDCNISWYVLINNKADLNISNMNLGTDESMIKTRLLDNSGTASIDTVTYKSSSGNITNTGSLTLDNVTANVYNELSSSNGTLDIIGGSYTSDNGKALNLYGGVVTIKNTSITSTSSHAISDSYAEISIENSNITSNNGYAIHRSNNSGKTDITIK